MIDLFRHRLIVSSKIFLFVSVNSVYNSALFLSPWCSSFLLHVVANFTCIFLVSRQLVLLSTLPKFLHYFLCSKIVYVAGPLKNFISIDVNHFLSFFLRAQIWFPCKRIWMATGLYTFIPEDFWTKVCLKVLYKIPSIWINFARFCWLSF